MTPEELAAMRDVYEAALEWGRLREGLSGDCRALGIGSGDSAKWGAELSRRSEPLRAVVARRANSAPAGTDVRQHARFTLYLAVLVLAALMPTGVLTLLACVWGGVHPVAGAKKALADLWLLAGDTEGEL